MIEKMINKLSPEQADRLLRLITNKAFIAIAATSAFVAYAIVYILVSLGLLWVGISILQDLGAL